MSLQRYTAQHISQDTGQPNGGRRMLFGPESVYLAKDADTELTRLRDESERIGAISAERDLLRRAVEWLKDSGVFSVSLSQQFIYGNSGSCDIPAEFADIIKPTTGASNG